VVGILAANSTRAMTPATLAAGYVAHYRALLADQRIFFTDPERWEAMQTVCAWCGAQADLTPERFEALL
jgi:hypothetical protein